MKFADRKWSLISYTKSDDNVQLSVFYVFLSKAQLTTISARRSPSRFITMISNIEFVMVKRLEIVCHSFDLLLTFLLFECILM